MSKQFFMGFLKGRDLLTLADLTSEEVAELLHCAQGFKAGTLVADCSRQVLGLIFTKSSTRTRVSFSAAMIQLGGQVLDLNATVTQLGRGEPIEDTARVLSRYLDVLAIRTFSQSELETYAHSAEIPVLNALTDDYHPCQALADLQTIQEQFGGFKDLTLTYLGDGNNVAHSLLLGCAHVGLNVRIASPSGYQPNPNIVARARTISQGRSQVEIFAEPVAAAQGAHILYTDVWASMGQEGEADQRLPVFLPYQINTQLLQQADPAAIVLHCLPAHRGEEITAEVMEGSQSRIWDQAENRLHAQKALLAAVLGAL